MDSNAKLECYTLKAAGVGAVVARALAAQYPPLNSAIGRNSSGHMEGHPDRWPRAGQGPWPLITELSSAPGVPLELCPKSLGPAAQSGSSGPSHLVPIRALGQDPGASADHISPTRPSGRLEATEEVREAEEGDTSASSSNQGSLLASPSNPPPQPRPGMPRLPWCSELGQLLGL